MAEGAQARLYGEFEPLCNLLLADAALHHKFLAPTEPFGVHERAIAAAAFVGLWRLLSRSLALSAQKDDSAGSPPAPEMQLVCTVVQPLEFGASEALRREALRMELDRALREARFVVDPRALSVPRFDDRATDAAELAPYMPC